MRTGDDDAFLFHFLLEKIHHVVRAGAVPDLPSEPNDLSTRVGSGDRLLARPFIRSVFIFGVGPGVRCDGSCHVVREDGDGAREQKWDIVFPAQSGEIRR